MLIRIVAFLLEAAFFVLIASALLRAWMNWVRVNMIAPPGSFVMALTDWLVKPLRRVLPRTLGQSRVDWASVLAAALMALGYALLWWVLLGEVVGGLAAAPVLLLTLLALGLKMLVRVALQTLLLLVLGFVILSWVQPGSPTYGLLGRLTEPFLTPLRRLIPPVGGVDVSTLVLLVLLQIAMMVLA